MSKRKRSPLGFIIVIVVLVFFGRIMIDQQKILYAKQNEMNDMQKKIAQQKKLNDELKKQKEILDTDEYAEKIAREKLGMVKPGEQVFVDVNR